MTGMTRLAALAASLVLVSGACSGGGRAERTVFVDFSHDEYASSFLKNFPKTVTVAQGDEIVFKQFWTGEPHSVTGGTLADELMEAVRPYLEKDARGEPIPEEPPKSIGKLEDKLVWAFTEGDDLNQTAVQPCYLERGQPRKDGKPCAKEQQSQPEFDGKMSYYNSGVIPYEGEEGNEYKVKLADDVDPGSYWFYCNVHGEFQSTEVIVKPKGSDVPTADEVTRQARKEIELESETLQDLYEDAQDGKITVRKRGGGRRFKAQGNFAGLIELGPNVHGSINEFVPKRLRVKAGEKIRWNLLGYHTISFGVPDYLPILEFKDDGTVERNKQLDPIAGGAKEFDISEKKRYSGDEPVDFDGGTYGGKGFWSSGLIDADPYIRYTMRIKKPGTYRYACLIHPPMVGTLVVS
jgi:plastocyanin